MLRIVSLIASLQEHLDELERAPAAYRPPRCPHCGFAGLWGHGHYERKADRDTGKLNLIPVPRFRCRSCRRTCSRLPSCLPPRRWYHWSVQQAVLLCLLSGASLRKCANTLGPARSTMRRWWQWLQQRHEPLAFHLRSRWPEWGRAGSWQEFWQLALVQEPLREVMAWLDQQGVVVP
jgi:transposase-like protein